MNLFVLILFAIISPVIAAIYNYYIIAWGDACKSERIDYYVLRKGWHRWKSYYRIAWYLFLPSYCFFFDIKTWTEVIFTFLILSTLHWIIFDAVLNKLMGVKLFYVGKTSDMDRWFGKWQFVLKAILLIITTLLSFYLKKS